MRTTLPLIVLAIVVGICSASMQWPPVFGPAPPTPSPTTTTTPGTTTTTPGTTTTPSASVSGIYKLGNSGTMNCPEGFLLVTNENECRASATKLGNQFGSAGCFGTEAPGCFATTGFMYFSTCSGSHPESYTGVCKDCVDTWESCSDFEVEDCIDSPWIEQFCTKTCGKHYGMCDTTTTPGTTPGTTTIPSENTCVDAIGYVVMAPNSRVYYGCQNNDNLCQHGWFSSQCKKTCGLCTTNACNNDQFKCDNGKCIKKSYVNDGDNDCGDHSDETGCVKWRQTGRCDADGPREPDHDQECFTVIEDGWSGYCECADGGKAMKKGCHDHVHSTCNEACNACRDTDVYRTDKDGRSCHDYQRFPNICGYYDDEDFSANDMCCACGGGGVTDCINIYSDSDCERRKQWKWCNYPETSKNCKKTCGKCGN